MAGGPKGPPGPTVAPPVCEVDHDDLIGLVQIAKEICLIKAK